MRRLVQHHWDLETARIDRWRAQGHDFLSQVLVDEGVATLEEIGELLSDVYGIEYIDPAPGQLDRDAFGLVPESVVRRYLSLPKALRDDTLELLTPNPLDAELLNEVEWVTGRDVDPWFSLPERLQALVARELGRSNPVEFDLLRKIETRQDVEVVGEDEVVTAAKSDVGPPIVRFVNSLIADAAERRVSDIHIEHERSGSSIRYRIDGELRTVMTLPRYVAAGPTVSRIKIMADMDLAERRQPQDGRAELRVGDRDIGLRVSMVPTKWGENVVLRLLDRENALVPLEELGFPSSVRQRFERQIHGPEGIVLVTGPTGSGKTTSLYAALARRRSEDINIVTIEDPVEYELEGLTQIEVEDRKGVTFASTLRSVLRQDPDVIMVGEIRDRETAEIACQAALTGHLVFSTLHTRNTTAAVTRLVDMGVASSKLSEGLSAVTAQRLVRRLCPECSRRIEAGSMDEELAGVLESRGLGTTIRRTAGCRHCDFEGYRGRLALVELLEVDSTLRQAISDGAGGEQLRDLARESDALYELGDDLLRHLSEGHTTYEEVRPYLGALEYGVDPGAGDEDRGPTDPNSGTRKGRIEVGAAGEPQHREVAGEAAQLEQDGEDAGLAFVAGAGSSEEALRSALSSRGFECEILQSAREALGGVVADDPDIVVVGPEIEGMEPADTIRRIRSVHIDRDLPVLLLAGSESEGEEGLRAGANDWLVVPVAESTLEDRLSLLLERDPDWPEPEEVMTPPTPYDEEMRLEEVRDVGLSDGRFEEAVTDQLERARELFDAPEAFLTSVEEDEQCFGAKLGRDADPVPRDQSFCAHAILNNDIFVVEDATLDSRFAMNPLVTGEPHIRFYAGCPIHGPRGHRLGALCVVGGEPRSVSEEQRGALEDLGGEVEEIIAAA